MIVKIAPAVAQGRHGLGCGHAAHRRSRAYGQRLLQFVYHSGTLMQPHLCRRAQGRRPERSRIVYAEGEDERVLRAVQIVVDEKLAAPILVGRPAVIERAIKRHGLRIRIGEHVTVVNPEHDERYREYWQEYHRLTRRNGVTAQYAKLEMRRRTTLIAAMLLKKGEADGLICGTISTTARHLHYIDQVIGRRAGGQCIRGDERADPAGTPGVHRRYARQSRSDRRAARGDHRARRRADCAHSVSSPRWRLLSHSNFGSSDAPSALKMRAALALLRERVPELEVDGEMHGDCALDEAARRAVLPDSDAATAAPICWSARISTARTSPTICSSRPPGNNVADRTDAARLRRAGAHI